jgi:diguanylate cyclase (GGDEF)-like protein
MAMAMEAMRPVRPEDVPLRPGLGLSEFDVRHPNARYLGPLLALVMCIALMQLQPRIYPELPIAVLYLVPVVVLVWTSGRFVGLGGAAVAALTRALVDLNDPRSLSSWTIPYWNFAISLPLYVLVAHLLQRMRVLLEREREMGMMDHLTQLGNRRFFLDIARVELNRTLRYSRPLALGYIDVDHFKEINDTRGHAAGDALLRLIANELTIVLRASDVVARIGGDEFAVLLPETSPEGAATAFRKMSEQLTSAVQSANYGVTFSVGAVTYESGSVTLDELLAEADGLMYYVKNHGKGAVLVRTHASTEVRAAMAV